MIGKLKGIVDSFGDDWVIVDVNGVGYVVFCSSKTLGALPRVGEAAAIAIETHVREDQIKLFGFAHDLERDWFRLLLSIQGVGPKVALAILGTLGPLELGQAVAMQDKALVSQAQGVGPKVALRIVNELKDKVPALSAGLPETMNAADGDMPDGSRVAADAVSALANLGYPRVQALGAVTTVFGKMGSDATVSDLIKHGLKELAR